MILLALGGLVLRDGRASAPGIVLLVLGAILGTIALVDYPYRCRFAPNGIQRRMALRTHHLAWTDLVALERTRPSTATVLRNLTDRKAEPQISGGLVARDGGRKRWLLTDRVEGQMEFDRLVALVATLDRPIEVRAQRPHTEATPTFLYRRQRHLDQPGS